MNISNQETFSQEIGGRATTRSERRISRLYEENVTDGLRFAYFLTGDRSSAEDLVQEAFVRVFARFGERREPRSFKAYFRRTILNLARTNARRQAKERASLESVRQGSLADANTVEEAARLDIWSAMLQLPIRQRTAVFLRYYQGLKETEVAESMGCSVGAVKSLVLRAKRSLSETVEVKNDG